MVRDIAKLLAGLVIVVLLLLLGRQTADQEPDAGRQGRCPSRRPRCRWHGQLRPWSSHSSRQRHWRMNSRSPRRAAWSPRIRPASHRSSRIGCRVTNESASRAERGPRGALERAVIEGHVSAACATGALWASCRTSSVPPGRRPRRRAGPPVWQQRSRKSPRACVSSMRNARALSRRLQHCRARWRTADRQVHEQIAELAIAIARQLIRRELKTDPTQIIGVVRETVGAAAGQRRATCACSCIRRMRRCCASGWRHRRARVPGRIAGGSGDDARRLPRAHRLRADRCPHRNAA